MKYMLFSNTHWPQLTAPFYSILFETSICPFNSSKFSHIMPDEVREYLTRDQKPFLHPESLQTLQTVVGQSFHQPRTVNENVLESDFVRLCDGTTRRRSLADLRLLEGM